jgi:hypothetical protein
MPTNSPVICLIARIADQRSFSSNELAVTQPSSDEGDAEIRERKFEKMLHFYNFVARNARL